MFTSRILKIISSEILKSSKINYVKLQMSVINRYFKTINWLNRI